MQLFLISGLSGSGKSIALKVLEDSGYYCVDNLPADMLAALVEHLQRAGYSNIAVSIDVRSANSVQRLPPLLQQIRQQGVDVHVLFLDAQTDTLVKRFSETRRLHPLSDTTLLNGDKKARTLPECVSQERELLAEISDIGHHIDTTELNANALRAWIKQFIKLDRARLTLLFQSFGYKHGIPLDSDLVFDVRCLPNPHYNPLLQPLTGRDAAVIDFLDKIPGAQAMYGDVRDFVERWLPSFVADNRSYLTVAIGCTGGQHRSVYLAEKLARHFEHQQQVLVRHRELTH
ncbi:MAG: glmZ(sRNA)-inactivating NTPase [Candidatus Gallionella acididurans]|uniref:GlmZ(SRNA)-inactivating NTPase n=1 Tax=Candidatus Gallionella acididurans TaxID=1796491 RepID=A0A139BUT8_9PROT|nr:MAG: glmZ(sRNA)-inactivating NTPase [Candidatus Gallionella acididurans]